MAKDFCKKTKPKLAFTYLEGDNRIYINLFINKKEIMLLHAWNADKKEFVNIPWYTSSPPDFNVFIYNNNLKRLAGILQKYPSLFEKTWGTELLNLFREGETRDLILSKEEVKQAHNAFSKIEGISSQLYKTPGAGPSIYEREHLHITHD